MIEPPSPPLQVYGNIQCSVCQGGEYSSQIVATGGQAPYSFFLIEGELPPGITLNENTGEITGTALDFGSWTFTVRIVDSLVETLDQEFTVSVLVIATGANELPAFVAGVPYSYQLEAVGGSGSYAWVMQSGAWPEGITMSQSGLISGTPTGVGVTLGSIELEVFDAACPIEDPDVLAGSIIDYDGNVVGDYDGQPCRRLSNERIDLDLD